ncbi:MAG TPA: hypothetical protein VE090_06740 [Methylomirabilota bacterium]|nr:hypothetical protein [Methylomirabilota bacterium]
MTKQIIKKPWEATHLRITLFPSIEFRDNPEKLWPKIDGLTLEESKTKPKTFESVFEGSFENLMVVMAVLPIKLDFIIKPPEQLQLDATSLPTVPSLSNYTDALNRFKNLAKLWVTQMEIESYKRIAFGTELLRNVSNRDEGYKELSNLLHLSVDGKDTTDFQLRINKPIQQEINDKKVIKINRLTTWDILRRNIGIGTAGEFPTSFKYPETYYNHIILDINTAPDQGVFTKKESFDIYTLLTKIGTDVSNRGIL